MILIRTPYSNNVDYQVQDGVYFAQRGYAVAIQDVRGRFDSEGEWAPFLHEAEDGYDAQEWCGTQPWSTGKVGTSGASYLALTQWLAAPLRNRHLAAMAPRVGFSNLYHNWVYTGGAFQLGLQPPLGRDPDAHAHEPAPVPLDAARAALLDALLASAARERATSAPVASASSTGTGSGIRTTARTGSGSATSRRTTRGSTSRPTGSAAGTTCSSRGPSTTSWASEAKGQSERARRQKVLIGPWIHSLGERGTQSRTGDLDFGPASLVDLRREELRWFDYWLRGVDDGIMSEPPVKVFVMGRNDWRTASDWPIPGTRFVPHYFHSGGHAATLWGDGRLDRREPAAEPPDRYVYDPADPVPTLGGSTCCGEDITPISMGPRDQRSAEWRPDVLVYSTPPLEADVEVTGPIKVVLWAASSAPDTDFTAKLVDVFPSGYVMNVAQGILRARYRDSFERPSAARAGAAVSPRDRLLVVVEPLPARAPDPGGDRLVELPAVRPAPQHGPAVRDGHRPRARDADRLPRRAAPEPHPAAHRRLTAKLRGQALTLISAAKPAAADIKVKA